MADRTWLFNNYSSVTSLSASNVISEDSTNATTVQAGTGGTIQSSSTHTQSGGWAAQVISPSNVSSSIRLPFVNAHKAGAVEWYHYIETAMPVGRGVFSLRHASGRVLGVVFNADGSISFIGSTSAAVGTASGAGVIQANTLMRYALSYDLSASSTVTLRAFVGDSTTPAGTASWNGADLSAEDITHIDIGTPVSITAHSITQWFDTVRMRDHASTEFGPYISSDPPNLVATDGQTWIINAGGSTTGSGGTLSYSISQTAGTSQTATQIASGIWSIPQGANSTQWTVTVTESPSGLTDSQNFTVPALSSGDGSTAPPILVWDGSTWR